MGYIIIMVTSMMMKPHKYFNSIPLDVYGASPYRLSKRL